MPSSAADIPSQKRWRWRCVLCSPRGDAQRRQRQRALQTHPGSLRHRRLRSRVALLWQERFLCSSNDSRAIRSHQRQTCSLVIRWKHGRPWCTLRLRASAGHRWRNRQRSCQRGIVRERLHRRPNDRGPTSRFPIRIRRMPPRQRHRALPRRAEGLLQSTRPTRARSFVLVLRPRDGQRRAADPEAVHQAANFARGGARLLFRCGGRARKADGALAARTVMVITMVMRMLLEDPPVGIWWRAAIMYDVSSAGFGRLFVLEIC